MSKSNKIKIAIVTVLALASMAGGAVGGMYLYDKRKASEAAADDKQKGINRKLVYVKMSKSLNIPLVENKKVVAILLVDAIIEGDEKLQEEFSGKEPLLRNNLLQVLYNHAMKGNFREKLLSERTQADLRYDMTQEAKKVFGDKVNAVLVGDFQRQEAD